MDTRSTPASGKNISSGSIGKDPYTGLASSRNLIVAMLAGIATLLLTAVLDQFFQPDHAADIWRSRWITVGAMGALTLVSASPLGRRAPNLLTLLFTVTGSVALLEFARLSMPPYHHYYNMSLIIVVMFCLVLTRMRFRWGMASTPVIFATCNLYWLKVAPISMDLVVILNFMVAATCLFSLLAAWQLENAGLRIRHNQQTLQQERDKLLLLQQRQQSRTWLSEGLEKFQRMITGEHDTLTLCQQALDFLGGRLPVGFAAAFHYRNDDNELWLVATRAIALSECPRKLSPGEGLAGEAARRETATVIELLPPGYPRITSGTGDMEPRQLIFLPLRYEERLKGLIELALTESVGETERELMDETAARLAQALELAEQRQR